MLSLAVALAALSTPPLDLPRHGEGALHVKGTQVVDDTGKPMHIMGVNIPSLEWTAFGESVHHSIDVAIDDWHVNFIRLPMNQDRWYGKGPDSKDDGTVYRKLVDDAVATAAIEHVYVLLDLHWSDGGQWGQNIGQHTLPDKNSLKFWKDCAAKFANQPYVAFDLYNEPINAPWKVWRDGGPVEETFQGKKLSYEAVGLQQLLDGIRSTGAKNMVVAGGLGYASQLDGLAQNALSDPNGNGVLYASHFYPGWESVDSWEKRIVPFAAKMPVIVSEFGSSPAALPLDDPGRRVAQVLTVLDKNHLSWVAWCMHPAAEPCVISDWKYTPTPYFGAMVKARLEGVATPIPARGSKKLADGVVYQGKLGPQWQSWGNATVDFADKTVTRDGRPSMEVDLGQGQQLQLGVVPFDGFNFDHLSLWMNGGPTGGQKLKLVANVMDEPQKEIDLPELKTGEWTHVDVSVADLGVADKENVKSFTVFAPGRSLAPTFYLADAMLVAKK